jgi:ABC-2 type transport system permease protein
VLGYVWTVLEPLMMAIVYWAVFTKLMQRTIGEDPYIVFLLSAMLPWQWANGVLRSSMRALSKDAKLVRSTSLPREIWVLRTVGAKFAEFVFALPVLIAFGVALGADISWRVVFVPLAVLIQAVLLTGAGLILAPLATLYGDVQKLMRIVMRLLFYFSPILYGLHDVQQKFKASIGGVSVADVYAFINPFVGIFDLYRASYFPDQWAGWWAVAFSAVVAVITLAVGILVFRRFEGLVLKEI